MSADGSTTQGLGLPRRGLDDLPGLQDEAPDVLRGASGEPPAGSGGDAGSALARAAALRFPDLSEKHGREKIDALTDHIMQTAIVRGDLEELRLQAHVNLRDALADLVRVPVGVSKPRAAVDDARRRAAPAVAERVDGARWLVERCTEQINRLGGSDYDAASRAYTLLSGS